MDKTKILLDDRKKQRGIHRSIPVNTPIILGNMPRVSAACVVMSEAYVYLRSILTLLSPQRTM